MMVSVGFLLVIFLIGFWDNDCTICWNGCRLLLGIGWNLLGVQLFIGGVIGMIQVGGLVLLLAGVGLLLLGASL